MNNMTQKLRLRKLLVSAVLLSIALIMKTYLTFYIPLFGENGMRIGLSGVFSSLPAILFGPAFGAAVSGLTDILGYLLKPVGAFMPLITLVSFLYGFLLGLIWNLLKKGISKRLRIAVLIFVAVAAAFGLFNSFAFAADGINASFYDTHAAPVDTTNMHVISRLLITRTQGASDPSGQLAAYMIFLTTALFGLAVLGLVLIAADYVITKKLIKSGTETGIMAILIALIAAGIIENTLVTIVLREVLFPSWKLLPFTVIWLPRIIERVVSCTINAYFIALLYGIFVRQPALTRIIAKNHADG